MQFQQNLARTTADGLQNTAISNNIAITAEVLARTMQMYLKTQLFK
jgi:hypothetical protein